MSKKLKVCIIAENYPTKEKPLFPFVQQLAYSLSNENCECYVIAPQSITRALVRKKGFYPGYTEDVNPEGKTIRIFRPKFVSFSNVSSNGIQKFGDKLFENAIKKALKKIGKVDVLYSYFWHIGLSTAAACKDLHIPMIVQASECGLTIHPWQITKENLEQIKGVVCASRKNLDESLEANLTSEDLCTIAVNGYRSDEFYPIDKKTVRRELGFDENAFIMAFIGFFIERKGVPQLCEALNRFDDVQSIFIGQGPIVPDCKNIVFKGKLPHTDIVKYLNCADVFVLPTNAEGCCNAIIEALACGLPVISSKRSFNDEILDDTCSIRIDESSVEEIALSIQKLKDDAALREQMSSNALKKSKLLTIECRAKTIRNFIDGIVNQ